MTIRLGDEFDDALRDAVRTALADLGAVPGEASRGIGGSQEIEAVAAIIDGERVMVEAETYAGLTITGGEATASRRRGGARRAAAGPKVTICCFVRILAIRNTGRRRALACRRRAFPMIAHAKEWKRAVDRLWSASPLDYAQATRLAAEIAGSGEPALQHAAAQALPSLRGACLKGADRGAREVARRRLSALRDALHALDAPRFGKRANTVVKHRMP